VPQRRTLEIKGTVVPGSVPYLKLKKALEELEEELITPGCWVVEFRKLTTDKKTLKTASFKDINQLLSHYLETSTGKDIACTFEQNKELRFFDGTAFQIYHSPRNIEQTVERKAEELSPELFARIWGIPSKTSGGKRRPKKAIIRTFLKTANKTPAVLLNLFE